MSRIVLNYHTAMAAGQDAGNRSMRRANRQKWSRADYNASVARVESLAVALYRSNHPDTTGAVPLDAAFYELQLTQGQPIVRQRSSQGGPK